MMQTPRTHQITLEEILNGEIDVSSFSPEHKEVSGTVTYFRESINEQTVRKFNVPLMIQTLEKFNADNEGLFAENRKSLYDTFSIPKRTGGLRRINAPKEPLMKALRELKKIFEEQMFALYHTSAFAYVKHRSTLDAIRRHQANGSKWFEKTDFSDFFGSTTINFVLAMMEILFPFSEIMKVSKGKEALAKALDLCFLDGGLPQGTPISPMLTNLMMIPIDHMLYNSFRKRGFVYTRYADDIQVSSRYDFDPNEVVGEINAALQKFNAPFKIKPEKTRYGSSAGRNWNLGLMLNKDNEITIGHRKKKQFKAMCTNYIMDRKKGVRWDIMDVYELNGKKSYYKMIEPEYISYIIDHMNKKFDVNLTRMIRDDLRNR